MQNNKKIVLNGFFINLIGLLQFEHLSCYAIANDIKFNKELFPSHIKFTNTNVA